VRQRPGGCRPPDPKAAGERALLAVLAVAALVYSLMQSLVVPALPAIQHSLGVSADTAGWAVTAFLLSSAVATPIAGRLGDMFGKGRVLVAVLAIVCAGTLLCTIPSLPALIGGRVVQGVSGGVLPLAYAIVRDEVDPAYVGRGIALIASLLGVGGGLGVIIAGVLVEHLSYTSMFWVQLPAFAAVAWGVHRVVPHVAVAAPVRIDWTGAVLVSSGLVMLLLTITQAGRWGLGSTATWLGLAIAGVLLAIWAWAALRHADPLLDVRLMLRRSVWTANAVAFLVGIGQFVGFIMLPRYVQDPAGFGVSPLASGLYLLPMTIAIVISGLAAGRLERRFDPRTLLLASGGLALAAFMLLTLARATPVEIYVASALHGLGTGLSMAVLATLIVMSVAEDETGAAAGVNNVARTLGGALGGQVAAVLLVSSGYTAAFAVGLVAMVGWLAVTALIGGAHNRLFGVRAAVARR
jgi:predicted MFS family arabinose efflux permease